MDFNVKTLGECTYDSPLLEAAARLNAAFVADTLKMRYNVLITEASDGTSDKRYFELAGAREKIYFKSENVKVAIVTCGGLCPGINDVIRSIVMESHYRYGIKSIFGIRYGYNGLNPKNGYLPVELTPELVEDIHLNGGTILGSSRGGTEDMNILVDSLESMGINILFTIGGDGTLSGAHEIGKIAVKRGLEMSVIGIPKTIDNDISFIQKSFGFESAFSKGVEAITTAHVEAKGAPNGIGLVKLMGRHSGFIAANATLAMNDVNFVLVPEIPFDLYGSNGFLAHLEKRLEKRHHAVICVAEGAGQELMKQSGESSKDASGNLLLNDIGVFLKNEISRYFREKEKAINLKYIDPSYIIRSTPANPNDSVYCALLGQFAVHAGMAGKTDMVIGQWNNKYTHVPIELAISRRKRLKSNSRFWYNVLEATGQPLSMENL